MKKVLDAAACYAAFTSHDPRFDGRFFVGVSSTSIYCRPICRVKLPKAENCSFYANAAAAEAAGYRPCLKCRPELAPGNSAMDASSLLARRAALAMEEEFFPESGLAGLARLAKRLHVSDRHLRRVFAAEYGVSPVQYMQTSKLLLAKSLLTDSTLSVTDVALSSGFGSIRRFNDLFKKHYRLSPRDVRKADNTAPDADEYGITLFLGYRPPYDWGALLAFLAGRAVPGVECVKNGNYIRTVVLESGGASLRGWIRVGNVPKKNALAVTVSPALLPGLPKLLAKVRVLFDTDCSPAEITGSLVTLGEHISGTYAPGTRLPGCVDPFEMSVRAVLGQQITVKAARTLAGRFAEAFGSPLATPFPELTHTFPTHTAIAGLAPPVEDTFGPLGIIRSRARSIFALAAALAEGALTLSRHADPEKEMRALRALPGFGPWTAEYIAMRALGWPDAFPHTDYGVKKALAGLTPKEIANVAEKWRPWRAYATIALWNSLAP